MNLGFPTQTTIGQPDIAWTDDLGLTVASAFFPLIPNTKIQVGDELLIAKERRTQDEQSVVSRWYNGALLPRRKGLDDLHASHSSRHALCGSSYRTNFHPLSGTCNTVTIKAFESELEALVHKCYDPLQEPFHFADSPNVIVQFTCSRFDYAQVLPYLVGRDEAEWVKARAKTSVMCGMLCSLATCIPIWQLREVWLGARHIDGSRVWSLSNCRLELQLGDILKNAGTPEAPRFVNLNEDKFTANWFELGCPAMTGLVLYQMADPLDLVMFNYTAFGMLATSSRLVGADVWTKFLSVVHGLGGKKTAIDELKRVEAEGTKEMPTHYPNEGKVRETFLLNKGQLWWTKEEATKFIRRMAGGNDLLVHRWTEMFLDKM